MENRLCVFDERGVECDDGWFELIDGLAHAAEDEIECLAQRCVPRDQWPRVIQIKQKFGMLRFRLWGPRSAALKALILMIEEESWRTCEGCGHSSGLAARESWPVCVRCRMVLESKYRRSARLSREARAESHEKLTAMLAQRSE